MRTALVALMACTAGVFGQSYQGYVDGANCSTISGWAWDTTQPNTPITVDIYDGQNSIANVPANIFRQDLLNSGKGNGVHGFSFATPGILKDNQTHQLRVYYGGTTTLLTYGLNFQVTAARAAVTNIIIPTLLVQSTRLNGLRTALCRCQED